MTHVAADAWRLAPLDVARTLGSDPARGLDAAEADRRLARHGPNELAARARRGPLRTLLAQFTDVMVLVLVGAAGVALLLREPTDAAVILVIVLLNGVLGFVQERRAERAMAALRAMAAPTARVRRGGAVLTVPAATLVPGDVVLLEAGNVVPADLRLVALARLDVDESALTGESVPVAKSVRALDGDVPLADRRAMAWRGTTVSYGRGEGLVVATGMRTELGRIATLLDAAEEPRTPLQDRLARLGTRLAGAALLLCAAIFALGLLRGEPPGLMVLTALSLAVAAIPEALPAVVTVALALGARRMARRQALVRRLPAVETLGSVTFVCTDKTGTLTENRMRLTAVRIGGGAVAPEGLPDLLRDALALSNDVAADADGSLVGDPTEVALAEAAGVDRAARAHALPRVAEAPFSSERARMTTLHACADGVVAFTKGAPEAVLPRCTRRLTAHGIEAMAADAAHDEARAMAAAGLRVLAIATRELPAAPEGAAAAEESLTLLALVGLMDPPRATARDAVATCHAAGIRVVMITGDHPATALAIATQLGIAGPGDRAVTGSELAQTDDAALAATIESARVFARVAPEDKIRLVSALQARGHYVAMTGDGLNDAPALRRANIGVAMGRGGTDVAREASHMVLLDDDFATIVNAVREGRRVYDNVRRFVRYVLTGNSGEIWALFLAPFLGLPLPLLPIHILWVNLVTDGLPGVALAAEPAEPDVMRRPPRPPAESLFARGLWQHVLWVGLLLGGLTLVVQWWAIRAGAPWRSMAFTVLTFAQMAHVLAIRSERTSLFTQGVTSNRPLLGAVLLTFALQLATLYLPPLQPIFRTEALTATELAVCVGAAALVFAAVELEKWLARRGVLYGRR